MTFDIIVKVAGFTGTLHKTMEASNEQECRDRLEEEIGMLRGNDCEIDIGEVNKE